MVDGPGNNSITMDEMEAAHAEPAKTVSGSELKLDSADLPDSVRGKSASEVATQIEALQTSLRISEAARLATQASSEVANRPAAPAAPITPVADRPKEYTREELTEMMQTDPVGTVALITDQSVRQAAEHFERRLGGITTGAVSSAEAIARQEYKTEFELFGKEIGDFKAGLRDQSVLGTQQGWDDMISFIRGKKGNLEKYIDHKTKATTDATAAAARTTQAEGVGFTAAPSSVPVPPKGSVVLDATQKEIASVLGISEADYIKNML